MRNRSFWLLPALLLVISSPASALETLEEVQECVRANAPDESLIQTLDVKIYDRAESYRTLHATGYWQRFDGDVSKTLIRVESPPELRGAAYLIIRKPERSDLMVYLPAVGKVRRLNARSATGSLFGTDFSYEDVDQLQRIASGKSELLADSQLGDRAAYVILKHVDPESGSAYENIRFHIDQETCALLRADFHEPGQDLRKQLLANTETLTQAGASWYTRELEMTDSLEQTRTEVLIENLEIDPEIKRSMFSESALIKRR